MNHWDFLIDRSDLANTKVIEPTPPVLGPGQIRARVDAFGLSANNITYAALGDMLGYWKFFEVSDEDASDGWGRVPVWGFAEVVESNVAGVTVGERCYGYLPMSTDVVMAVDRVQADSFRDVSAHRADLPAAYNTYSRNSGDPGYDPAFEPEQMLLRPLFLTSYLIDDFIDDRDRFGAGVVVTTSASSKTAIGTAHLLRRRDGLRVIGLTSERNVDFVVSTGCYDEVLTYADAGSLRCLGGAILIDFAGNADLVHTLHRALGDDVKHSAIIGDTHWDATPATDTPLPGPAQEFFFAPSQMIKRSKEWGPQELQRRIADAWMPFLEAISSMITIDEHVGPDALNDAYLQQLAGSTSPDRGVIVRPGEGAHD